MLSNGAVHISNNVFLSVVRDDVDHAYLFTEDDVSSHAPLSLLTLSRAVRFDLQVDGVTNVSEITNTTSVTPPISSSPPKAAPGKTLGKAQQASPKPLEPCRDHVVGHPQLSTSSDGQYTIAFGPFQRRHLLIYVPKGDVAEVLLPHAIAACAWHPHEGHVLFLLGVDGSVTAVDVSTIRHNVAPRLLARITAEEVHQALLDRTLHALRRKPTETLSIAKATSATEAAPPKATDSRSSAKEAARSIHFVALSMVAETPGLPTMLLILSSRGDIISLKIGSDFLPACDATMAARLNEQEHLQERGYVNAHEATALTLLGSWQQPAHLIGATSGHHHKDAIAPGATLAHPGDSTVRRGEELSDDVLGRTTVFALAAAMHHEDDGDHHVSAAPLNALYCVHHVVQPFVADAANVPSEYAVALTVHVVDAYAGLHCVTVLYTSGELRGYLLHERDLLSVDLRKHRHEYTVRLTDAPVARPTKAQVETTLEWKGGAAVREALLHYTLTSSGNLMVVKAADTPRQNFVVAFPVWHALQVAPGEGFLGEWVYLEPHRQGAALIPSPGYDSSRPPAPLATRVPLDMTHYSVALGSDGLLLLFPDRVGPLVEGKQPLAVVAVATVELLLSALHAQIGSTMVVPDPSTTQAASTKCDHEGSRSKVASAIGDCVLLAAEQHRHLLVESGHTESNAFVFSPPPSSSLMESSASAVYETLFQQETAAREKRERIAARLAGLSARAAASNDRANHMASLLTEAMYSREGMDEVHRTNDVLGQIKTALNELQHVVAWRGECDVGAVREGATTPRRK